MRSVFFVLFLLTGAISVIAGESMEVKARFVPDKAKIGQPVNLLVTATYPADWQISFAESSYDFFPFIYLNKSYRPTARIGELLVDSVFYELTLFETDTIKWIRVPVYHIREHDSVIYKSDTAGFELVLLITEDPENQELKTNTLFQDLLDNLKYYYWAIAGILGLIVCIILFFIFRKQIKKYFLMRKLKKIYSQFDVAFSNGVSKAENTKQPGGLEEAYTAWKLFFQKLDNELYTTYSTTEILKKKNNPGLKEALSEIDRAIYGKMMPVHPAQVAGVLRDIVNKRYQQEELIVTYGRRK